VAVGVLEEDDSREVVQIENAGEGGAVVLAVAVEGERLRRTRWDLGHGGILG
jgi:hypothetical protein